MFGFKLVRENEDGNLVDFFVDYCEKSSNLTSLAIEAGINKIADVIAKCGFMVISKDSDSVGDIEYQLNVKPNVNQNATDFWKQAVARMIMNPEGCLIVNLNKDGIFIADSWQTDNTVIKERTYRNVNIIVDGDIATLRKTFKSSDVVHLRYSNPELMKLLKASGGKVDELLSTTMVGLKAKLPKVKVTVNGQAQLFDQETGTVITSNEYAKKVAKALSSDEIRSVVAGSGIEISAIDMKSTLTTADMNNLKEFIFGLVASALGVPKSILMGDTIAQSNEEFLTYACDPIAKIVNNAVCGAWMTKDEYISGDRIILRSWCVQHIDLISSADKVDKLLSNGMTWNEIFLELGRPTVDEDWANVRRFTKNYAEQGEEGGEPA